MSSTTVSSTTVPPTMQSIVRASIKSPTVYLLRSCSDMPVKSNSFIIWFLSLVVVFLLFRLVGLVFGVPGSWGVAFLLPRDERGRFELGLRRRIPVIREVAGLQQAEDALADLGRQWRRLRERLGDGVDEAFFVHDGAGGEQFGIIGLAGSGEGAVTRTFLIEKLCGHSIGLSTK